MDTAQLTRSGSLQPPWAISNRPSLKGASHDEAARILLLRQRRGVHGGAIDLRAGRCSRAAQSTQNEPAANCAATERRGYSADFFIATSSATPWRVQRRTAIRRFVPPRCL